MKLVMLALLAIYSRLISPVFHSFTGARCRFHPTCSAYAREAIELHGAWRGGYIALRRLSRCHPFHAGGVDLVPRLAVGPNESESTHG